MAITEGLEEAIYLKSFMSEIGISLSIEAFTDNLSLREALYSTKQVDDKQTRIDIAALQQMLQENKVKQINCLMRTGKITLHTQLTFNFYYYAICVTDAFLSSILSRYKITLVAIPYNQSLFSLSKTGC